jgi:hypothetical protein
MANRFLIRRPCNDGFPSRRELSPANAALSSL